MILQCFVITFIMILRSFTYSLANSSPHMQQFASLILQASRGAGLNGLLLEGGCDYANHPNPEAMYAEGLITTGHCQRQIGSLYEQNR